MKIAVIGCHRTRSSALQQYITTQYNNHTDLFEYYASKFKIQNYLHKKGLVKNYNQILVDEILSTSEKLLEQENFVVKILGSQFDIDLNDSQIDSLLLHKYDQLNLIERHNFFDSCCSLEICFKTNVWLNVNIDQDNNNHKLKITLDDKNQYKKILEKDKKYNVSKRSILRQAYDVANYLKIKSYLNNKKLSYKLYNYNDDIFSVNTIGIYEKVELNYPNRIVNYHLYESVNNLFHKHFNYQDSTHNYLGFKSDLDKLTILY